MRSLMMLKIADLMAAQNAENCQRTKKIRRERINKITYGDDCNHVCDNGRDVIKLIVVHIINDLAHEHWHSQVCETAAQ